MLPPLLGLATLLFELEHVRQLSLRPDPILIPIPVGLGDLAVA